MIFGQDLCKNLRYDQNYLGKQNSTLGSVVPLAMFSEQRGVWGEKPSYKTFPPQKRSPTATTALLIWSWDGTSTILTSVQLLHQIVGHLHLSQHLKIWTNLHQTQLNYSTMQLHQARSSPISYYTTLITNLFVFRMAPSLYQKGST